MSLIGNDDNQPSPFENLVGVDKKFKDADALAQGKLEGDRYIEELKAQLAEAQEKLTKSNHAEELLKKLQEKEALTESTATPVVVPDSTQPQDTTAPMSEEDLKALVQSTLAESQSAATEQANVKQVNDALIRQYGEAEKAQEAIKKKASELKVSTEYLEDVAKGNPAVFFKLISDGTTDTAPAYTPSAMRTDVNSDRSQLKDWAYYTKMRKENPSLYKSPAIRKEMDDQMVKMGNDRFFNR